jgi:hypothetical protein
VATPEQLRELVNARPFIPFVVNVGGRSFTILHPENAACDLRGRDMTLYDKQGKHLVDMRLVEVVEPQQSSVDPTAGGGGAPG